MMNRRGLLRLLGGGALAGATVDPKEAIKKFAAVGGYGAPEIGAPAEAECFDGPRTSNRRNGVYDLRRAIYTRMEMASEAAHRMPPHIAAMKSWSPVFKQSEAVKEAIQLRRLLDALDREDETAMKLVKLLGFE